MMMRALLACTSLLILPLTVAAGNDSDNAEFAAQRKQMVNKHIAAAGVNDKRVLKAMRNVARHKFVPDRFIDQAYANRPLPIGHQQTISQPYIVAAMTELAAIDADDKVLEIGTGSGYQAAILGVMADEVYSIEIIAALGRSAKKRLKRLGYNNVHVRIGDGYKGWPEQAPFDAIIVTAAIDHIPGPLKTQLKTGGRMVIPVNTGTGYEKLIRVTKTEDGNLDRKTIAPVRFVPFLGPKGSNNK